MTTARSIRKIDMPDRPFDLDATVDSFDRKVAVNELTPLDYFRLGVFATLHGGQLPCVPPRVTDTYQRLATAGLVSLEDDTLEIPHGCDVDNIPVLAACITPEGQAVVGDMLAAGRATIDELNRPYVCPGCHAVAPDHCLPGCIDHEIEEEQRESIESGDYSRTEYDDEG